MSAVPYNITVVSPPNTYQVAFDMMAAMAAQSGVVTDYNVGSQVSSLYEALGSPIEMQGTIGQALAFQALVYSAMSIFKIYPIGAIAANGSVTFSTGTGSSPPPAPYNITIPQGTIVQTNSGTQYQTTSTVILLAGQTSISATVTAINPGVTGNTGANTITNIPSSLPYFLFVTNPSALTNGENAEQPSQTLGRFIAKINSLGLATPVSIANAVIGVSVSGTTETVMYSTVYEPWIATGSVTGQAGYYVYVDNGSGNASTALLDAVQTYLNGSFALNEPGFRPAGVPYEAAAVVPTDVNVTVTGVANNSTGIIGLEATVTTAINNFFATLQFGQTLLDGSIIAVVSNVVGGQVSTLNVVLTNSSGTVITQAVPSDVGRVILSTLSVTFT